MRRPPLYASLIAWLLLLVAGCATTTAGSPGPIPPEAPGAPSTAAPASVPPEPAPSDPPPPPSRTTDTYDDDLRTAFSTVVEYWSGEFADASKQFHPVENVVAYSGTRGPPCGRNRLPAKNAAYCHGADFIGYDTTWLRQHWRGLGDTFVYFVVGHEYGHAVQARLGLTASYTIKAELQADCFAGAYIGESIDDGRLELQEGDLTELFESIATVADKEGTGWLDPGAHGSANQRRVAFFTGYFTSSGACTTEL